MDVLFKKAKGRGLKKRSLLKGVFDINRQYACVHPTSFFPLPRTPSPTRFITMSQNEGASKHPLSLEENMKALKDDMNALKDNLGSEAFEREIMNCRGFANGAPSTPLVSTLDSSPTPKGNI